LAEGFEDQQCLWILGVLQEVFVDVGSEDHQAVVVVFVIAVVEQKGEVLSEVLLLDAGVDSVELLLVLQLDLSGGCQPVLPENGLKVVVPCYFLEFVPGHSNYGLLAHLIIMGTLN
jgi:hypothetical protein